GPAADRKGYIVGTMGRYASMRLASAVVGLAPLVAGCTERTPRVPESSVSTPPAPPAPESTSGVPVAAVESTRAVPAAAIESSAAAQDRKSTRLNSSHGSISYAVFCLT